VSLPASILALLESQNVSFNVTNLGTKGQSLSLVAGNAAPIVVKSLLVQDGKSRVQVLLPADHILDLDAMFRQLGRRFEGVATNDVRSMINLANLAMLPAVPSWQGMETFVDASLLKKDRLLLESGDSGNLLDMRQEEFAPMLGRATAGNFTFKAPTLTDDPDSDEAQILDSVQKFTERRIRQRLDDTLELPPLPETAQRIIKLRADPNADISDLTSIVEIDPSLAAQVVSWAASPYYSAPGKIKSVHDAIVRVLGFDMVLNLALGLALGKTLSMKALTSTQINEYWRGAVYTAAAVEGLITSIERKHRPGFGMAYLSGLLSNFGNLILAEIFPPYFSNITRMCAGNPHQPSAAIEHHIIGVTGNQIASCLLGNWSMPAEVVIALRQKYNTNYEGMHQAYPKLVYIAQYMLSSQGFGDSFGVEIPGHLFDQLHLDPDTAKITISNILDSGGDLDAIANNMRG
jgi:HD-like signal output (HDOD) protein/prolyl-tRNA editing enzyme YbaK/EbsC (Cys-tRNA(Pro) deacylase)